ncbi:MAG TPA: ABC transporter ATP-binding protein [Baekduia sp.]|nr:ABC transporter ATP-binding protein [Baekduia sp.]
MSVPPPNASEPTEDTTPARRRRRAALRLRRARPSPWEFLRDFPRVLPYLRPHRRLAAGSLIMVGVSSVVTLLSPWPLAILIDTVLGDKPLPSLLGALDALGRYQLLAIAVVAGLLVTGLEHGLAVVDNYVNTKLDQNMVLDLRSDMFRHAQRLSLAWHDNKRTGMLMYQINNQASAVGSVTVAMPPLLQSVLTLGGMFFVVYKIEPTLALVALTVVPFVYYSAGYYARRIQPKVLRVRNLEGQSLTIVHEAMAMLRVIIAFGREKYEHRRFLTQSREAVDARVDLTVRQTIFSLVVTMTTAIGTALVLGFGAWYVLQHRMTTGELLVVMGYVAALYKPLEQISHTLSNLQQQFISLRNALDLLDTEPQILERPDAVALGPVAGEVTYEGVYFGYPGRPGTLKNVSFTAPPGARVAVVGPTGAGKSTLLHLLPRFYDPQHGRVLIDGQDLRGVRLEGLREQIGIIHQEPLLFADTIRANIGYGRLDATEAEIVAAAQAANAHDFITALPKGYETELGERGAQLSGGERQRISVARAFLKDAPILILDEPTSAIDSRTEAVILEALERLMQGRTTFMVAHRLSTIRDSDLILVVNGGRIAEHGTHDQLLARGGLYAELHDAQVGAPRRAAAAVSADGLSELTSAIAEGRQGALTGPALAELARTMADEAVGEGPGVEEDAVWLLAGAAWPLLHDGSPDALRQLAAADGRSPALASQLARRMLADLGLEAPADADAARDRREAA